MTDEERKAKRKAYKLAWWRAFTAKHPEKVRAYNKSYYAANRAAISEWGKRYRSTRKERLHAAERTWRLANQEKRSAYRKTRYKNHRSEEIAYGKAHRAANMAKWRAWYLKYRDKNSHSLSQKNKNWALKNRAYLRAYRQATRGRINARTAKRRARLLRATPVWASLGAIERMYETALELSRMTGVRYEVDHIYPLQSRVVCGLHCEDNLQIITKSENASKGNRLPTTAEIRRALDGRGETLTSAACSPVELVGHADGPAATSTLTISAP